MAHGAGKEKEIEFSFLRGRLRTLSTLGKVIGGSAVFIPSR